MKKKINVNRQKYTCLFIIFLFSDLTCKVCLVAPITSSEKSVGPDSSMLGTVLEVGPTVSQRWVTE